METAVLDPVTLADTPLERIESEITELAAHLAAAECRWLLLIATLFPALGRSGLATEERATPNGAVAPAPTG